MKRLATWFIIGLCLLLISGCTAANEATTEIEEDKTDMMVAEAIIGSWEAVESEAIDNQDSIEAIRTITFNEDGTFTETVATMENGSVTDESEIEGIYLVDGYEVELIPDEGEEIDMEVALDGDLITLTPQGSISFELRRVG